MYSIKEYYNILDELAPFVLSKKMMEKGMHDNSGIIVNNHDKIERVLFTLDLSVQAVKRAKAQKVDTIITHHPAIYYPIYGIDFTKNSGLGEAVKAGLNVISAHLNLDVAENGIDANLAKGLNADKYKIIENVYDKYGYGREFPVNKTLIEVVKDIRKEFKTRRIIYYGKRRDFIKNASSYCGDGSSVAIDAFKSGKLNSDLIITSDMPHHVILELVENNKDIIILPHYTAENYGFKKFYDCVKGKTFSRVQSFYFEDKRFI